MTLDYVPAYDDGNLVYHMRDDGIQYFMAKDMRRDALDRWFDITNHNRQVAAQRGEPVIVLFEIELAWPTPYMTARVRESVSMRVPGVETRSAIHISDSFLSNLFLMFLQSLPANVLRYARFFKDQDEAIAWLRAERETLMQATVEAPNVG